MAASFRPISRSDPPLLENIKARRLAGLFAARRGEIVPCTLQQARAGGKPVPDCSYDINRGGSMRIDVRRARIALAVALVMALPEALCAEPLKVLTAGAFKQVLLAVVPQFQATGQDIAWDNDTVGGLVKRIEAGENFDLVIASPAALAGLAKSGKISGAGVDLAKVGVGVAVKEGAARPDISTVEGFKQALRAAKSVAYIDPAAGGSSGIYVSGLLDRLGIGAEVRPKSVLVRGGYSADRVASGEAELAVQQISELLPVMGVVLVGPLPAEIQSYTVYSAGIAADTPRMPAARALISLLRSPEGTAAIRSKGMEPASDAPAKPQ
jgi:molybdate transport system substrate-binding protein